MTVIARGEMDPIRGSLDVPDLTLAAAAERGDVDRLHDDVAVDVGSPGVGRLGPGDFEDDAGDPIGDPLKLRGDGDPTLYVEAPTASAATTVAAAALNSLSKR